jgi:ComF family protein
MKIAILGSRVSAFARAGFHAALTLLYPPHCAVCHADTEAGVHLCVICSRDVEPLSEPRCERCSQPFFGAISGPFTCSNCEARKLYFDCAVAPYRSRKAVREFIHRFKYNRHYYLRHQLADWMAHGLSDERLTRQVIDGFVPVPLHPARQREREFNQADVLAGLLSRRTGTPVDRCLQRTRYTTTQTQLDRDERMENLRGAFRVRNTADVTGRHLVLIDDVFTTGSTVDECSRILREAGAASVRVLTVARG